MRFTDEDGDMYELEVEHTLGHAVGDYIMWTVAVKKGELPKKLSH